MFNNKRILVTGGTGSWGHELIRQLLPQNPEEIIIFSRSESAQVAMSREYEDNRLSFVIGDIRDKDALVAACRGVDYIIHLAALKHVPVCEDQPYEALKTNVIGTQNVIEAAIANHVEKAIYISTDKAANPSNFYGMTKAIGEKLFVYANLLRSGTRFVTVRGGNVLGTNGSVVHLFMKQIRDKGQVRITDMHMTRFFLTLRDAISLLFKASEASVGGEIFVMTMPTCRIIDLAEVLIEASGKKDVSIIETGIRPGEKIHEILMSDFESRSTVVYDEQYLVILPTLNMPELKECYQRYAPVSFSSFSSERNLISKDEIRAILQRGGFL
ncbi:MULTISPECIES: polysaccharide biosynthesis protein [unclassified Paenibacillus]|uniref:polysaccharide biosynthesis protein n=1 Tax=unclassified Paenibacillus TaxID=185978 RepID=UPI0024061BD3|nr:MULTISPECIES: polysaccharide biosynthesis protein [unclassified Paenibacillus]MDF9844985.1 UDP-N-acetylglucosamine 4,6-dehydratase [Paenibacillus sp. PastF-2]MDF9851584.1 UDP-N-acetylglucosamine 4,6-dehydratase [Paenibacillus sp. PastM-2]MDF9858168.1 UDP-N-acetylglucosamine 4,6-dehydratase [Paenibacillus sp. PastF-1]MDH6483394.1 UDP-N-acetylglucosamine 4,6-dehydratase [Paenibacillus sp. PastH-2]MDH6510844.1 UDP-N-acetylglucosamine 4,6-dehydratase [Paenibacillus sp. PastM-3]